MQNLIIVGFALVIFFMGVVSGYCIALGSR